MDVQNILSLIREHLLLDEILGYKASILALQELDTKCYKGEVISVC